MNRRAITACALALIFAAMSGKAALAQDRGRDRRPDRPDTTRARSDTTREAANGANAQGGHVTTDADRAIIQAEQERQARQAEADRQAAQGRRPDNQGRQPGYDQGRQGAQGWQGREAPNGADRQGGHTPNAADRQVIQQDQFNNRDREVTRDWYRQNQRHPAPGWRQQDRLSPSTQRRLRRGYRLDPEMRRQIHSLPPDLSRRYGPAPRGYRYAVIGGNVVLLDDSYEVHDIFTLTLTF